VTGRLLAGVALLEALRLRWPGRRPGIDYAAFGPEPVPANWQAVEPRWDCQHCRGTCAAVEVPGGYRCLNCGTTAPAEPQHLTLTGEPA
jgi:hypothetical protein